MPLLASALVGFFLFSGVAAADPASAKAPDLPTFSVHLTGYNAVPGQTDSTPDITSIGAYSNPEVIAARSQDLADVLPYGTVVEIDGPAATSTTCGYRAVSPLIGYRVIGDAMNSKIKNSVDVLFATSANYVTLSGREVNASTLLGSCDDVTIRIVGRVDINHIPATAAALKQLIEGKSDIALAK